jgi:hypothetical protein
MVKRKKESESDESDKESDEKGNKLVNVKETYSYIVFIISADSAMAKLDHYGRLDVNQIIVNDCLKVMNFAPDLSFPNRMSPYLFDGMRLQDAINEIKPLLQSGKPVIQTNDDENVSLTDAEVEQLAYAFLSYVLSEMEIIVADKVEAFVFVTS